MCNTEKYVILNNNKKEDMYHHNRYASFLIVKLFCKTLFFKFKLICKTKEKSANIWY